MKHLKRMTAQEAGISPASLAEMYRSLEDPALGLHSFMVYKNGGVAAEAWWAPYRPELGHTLFSASKTYAGLAIGFAVQDGLLSLDDRVVSFFPEYLPSRPGENMEKMKIRHLLTMSTGFAADPHDFPWPRPDDVLARSASCFHQEQVLPAVDWVRNFFQRYVAYEPGSEFVYCTHASYLLAVIVQRVTGRTAFDYLKEKLFDPLGMGSVSWELSPDGYNVGGWGLMLTTEDLLKTGVFLLQKGQWEGQQLLASDWVEQATDVQIPMDSASNPQMAGYGYQIWISKREGAFLLRGACGQVCMVFPELGAVVAYTSGANGPERQTVEKRIWDTLVPGMKEPVNSPEGETAWQEEQKRMEKFRIPTPEGQPSWKAGRREASGQRYLLGDNRLNWDAITFRFAEREGERDSFTLESREGTFTAEIGFGEWKDGVTCVRTADTDTDVSILFEKVSAAGAWQEDGRYELRLCFRETSYINNLKISFAGNGMVLEHTRNCSFMQSTDTILTGAALAAAPEVLRKQGIPKKEPGYH